jgi:hypothetical protein
MLRAWIEKDCQAEAASASYRFWKDYLHSAVVNICLDDANKHREGP